MEASERTIQGILGSDCIALEGIAALSNLDA